jgi:hypothetical protein
MTASHVHAAFDRFPQLLHDLETAFGGDDLRAIADRFIAAERAEFCWEGRIAEMKLGVLESLEQEGQALARVAILGYFRGRYYVATCLVDGVRDVHALLRLREFDEFEAAEAAFVASG